MPIGDIVATYGSPEVAAAIYGSKPKAEVEEQHAFCTIIPPHIERALRENAEHGALFRERHDHCKHETRNFRQLRATHATHAHDGFIGSLSTASSSTTPVIVKVYDAKHRESTSTRLSGPPKADNKDNPNISNVHNAFQINRKTIDFYKQIFGQNSINGRGIELDSFVNYGVEYDNAFFDGRVMCYGNGDGEIFGDFTYPEDIGAHEITHGVTQYMFNNLTYQGEPGQGNESASDVFGSMVKQWIYQQSVDKADWLIGHGLLLKPYADQSLRSMKAPGTAYNNPILGKDPQPNNYADLLTMKDPNNEDNGLVHVGSSMGNYAFYLTCKAIFDHDPVGGHYSWQRAGRIWYETLRNHTLVKPNCTWEQFANATIATAKKLFPERDTDWQAVQGAWTKIGVLKVGKT